MDLWNASSISDWRHWANMRYFFFLQVVYLCLLLTTWNDEHVVQWFGHVFRSETCVGEQWLSILPNTSSLFPTRITLYAGLAPLAFNYDAVFFIFMFFCVELELLLSLMTLYLEIELFLNMLISLCRCLWSTGNNIFLARNQQVCILLLILRDRYGSWNKWLNLADSFVLCPVSSFSVTWVLAFSSHAVSKWTVEG